MDPAPDSLAASTCSSARLPRFLGALCLWHALTLVICILPGQWRSSGVVGEVLGQYQNATGTRQEWTMFHTIPVIHRMEVRLEATDPAGTPQPMGAVLPGFQPYPLPEEARYYSLFDRMTYLPQGQEYADALLARAANELGPVMDAGQAPLTLVIDAWYTRSLMGIQKLGETAVERTKVFRPSGIPTRAP